MEDYAERKLREIEQWFRERGITLEYFEVGDDEIHEWVALMVPDGHKAGLVDGGGGPTKLAAAEDARARVLGLRPYDLYKAGDSLTVIIDETVQSPPAIATATAPPPTPQVMPEGIRSEEAVGEPTVTAMPPEVREPLEKIAAEYGWYVGGVAEPDGSI